MVTAGVYLIVRMHALFLLAPETLHFIGAIGGITSLFAALCAIGQTDLKRVLAYSTVSQLGLMFLACGAGAFYAAMFHLTTHAFVKGLLFLSAGNVIHMTHGVTSMEKMGGLWRKFSKTHWFFLIGALALSGIPPFAAFFSKDMILEQEYLAGFKTLFYVGLTASILTGLYLMRAYCLTFTGSVHIEKNIWEKTKEAPPIMLFPVTLLAFLSILGGFLGFSFGNIPPLARFLRGVGITSTEQELSSHILLSPEFFMAIGGAILGVGVSVWLYTQSTYRSRPPLTLFKKSFFIDPLYEKLFVTPGKSLARLVATWTEPYIFEGSLSMTQRVTQRTAALFQQMQSGQIRSYVAWMIIGMVCFIVYFVL
jgi:NADH-quinone oxidoreductase subunit L